MAYYHGVKTSEIATSVISAVETNAGLPVVFGTAPVHLTEGPATAVNKPVICYSYEEAVAALGYSNDWEKFTLCEQIYAQFKLYGVAPIVFVNVLDPERHKKSSTTTVTLEKGVGTVAAPVLLNTLKVTDGTATSKVGTINTDFTAAFNADEELVITVVDGGVLADSQTLQLTYDEVDASGVKAADIIGGVDSEGNATGLELLDEVYHQFSIVPGLVAAPGWTQEPTVASVMKAKSRVINNLFRATSVTDIDTKEVKKYTDAYMWKTGNGYTGAAQIVCWPMVRNGDYIFHMSTHIIGIIGQCDASNSDIPTLSPSNKDINITGLCLADGKEVSLNNSQANLLNSQGIMTALNVNGWKSWGNYTGAYPGTTDVKDTFICVRRFFDWDDQTFILTYWQKVDMPILPRNIKTVLDSEGIRLNGLTSRGFILGGRIEFKESENPVTDLLAGKIRFHKYRTPPIPAQEIESISEYDVSYFEQLFK